MRNLLLILLVFGFALTQAQHHHEEKSGNKVTIQKAAEGQNIPAPCIPRL